MKQLLLTFVLLSACSSRAFSAGDALPDGALECELPIPAGMLVSASLSKSIQPPELAIDGDLATAWNAGESSADFWLTLPAPVALSEISLFATASPASQATYVVSELREGSWLEVGRVEVSLAYQIITLVEIPLPEQPYQDIRISLSINPSWAAIYEIGLLGACP